MKWLFLIIMPFPILAKSQIIKKDTVLLKPFHKGDTLVFDIGHDKLYFELPLVLKYLNNYHGGNIYKKTEIAVLIKALKKPIHGVFYLNDTLAYDLKTNFLDTTAMQNKYIGAINEVIPAMLLAGHVMIVEDQSKKPIPYLFITRRKNGNYFGAFIEFEALHLDGRRLYKTSIYHQ